MKRILIIAAAALFMAVLPQTASAQDNREPQGQNYRQHHPELRACDPQIVVHLLRG